MKKELLENNFLHIFHQRTNEIVRNPIFNIKENLSTQESCLEKSDHPLEGSITPSSFRDPCPINKDRWVTGDGPTSEASPVSKYSLEKLGTRRRFPEYFANRSFAREDERHVRNYTREWGTRVKRGGTATPWSNLDVSSVGRRSFVSQRQPCASFFSRSLLPSPSSLPFRSLARPLPSIPRVSSSVRPSFSIQLPPLPG